MAYNYLELVNSVCRRLNEAELTTSNFASAAGQHGHIKDAINYSLRDINQDEYEWPFNHCEQEETLVAGTVRYAFPNDLKTLSMDTFRIKRDDTFGNQTQPLRELMYEEYVRLHIDNEYNTSDTSIRTLPRNIARTPDMGFALVPAPDKAYELVYEYYRLPPDLELHSDVPTVPEQFKKVIINGAMYYTYQFRSDTENTQLALLKFEKDLKNMRSLFINRYSHAKSTMIERKQSALVHERVS